MIVVVVWLLFDSSIVLLVSVVVDGFELVENVLSEEIEVVSELFPSHDMQSVELVVFCDGDEFVEFFLVINWLVLVSVICLVLW